MRHLRLVALLSVGTFVVACSSDSTGPATPTPTDLNTVVSQMTLSPYAAAAASAAGVPVPSAAGPMPSTCTYTASSQSFVCTPVTTNGMTFTESFMLLDAAGAAQSQFSPTTTAAVRTNTTMNGTQTTTTGVLSTLTISATQALTMSGLLSGVHTLNGTSATTMSGTVTTGGATSPVTGTVNQTIADLVLPTSTANGVYPLSGSISMDGSMSIGTGTPAVNIHETMVFNGTSKVTMTMVVAGITTHCVLDLTGKAAPVCG